jgi:hypothetical protein
MRKHLLSFCIGYQDNKELVTRFETQARETSFFDEITVVDGENHPLFIDFKNANPNLDLFSSRGYGYWTWKPFIVLELMKKLNDGDILIYADIGCEFSIQGQQKFNLYKEMVKKIKILAWETNNGFSELSWSKRELIDHLNLQDNLLHQEQIAATFFMVYKCPDTVNIISEWVKYSKYNNYIFINDKTLLFQYDEFIDHRHDQSILSLLLKSKKIKPLEENLYFRKILYYKGSYILKFPFHPLRNKTKDAVINNKIIITPNLINKLIFQFYNIFRLLKKKLI